MKKTAIGSTGVEITGLAFGTGPLSDMPDTYGYSVNEVRAHSTVRAIFDGPANVIDTSRNYGFGRAEERIGHVIRERGGLPDGFVISTKLDRDMDTLRFDSAQARRSLEESLEALGVDRVGILHLHDPEHARDLGEAMGKGGAIAELFKMKEEGLAQAVGLAMGRLDIMLPAVREWPFDILLNHSRYSLLNRSADALLDLAHEQGMAIMNAGLFASGVLAKGTANSRRLTYADATDEELAPVRSIEAVCAAHGVLIAAVALQFSLRDPRVTSTVLGVSTPGHVADCVRLADLKMPQAAWDDLMALPFATDDPQATREYKPG